MADEREQKIREQFEAAIERHEMSVLFENGLYRHIRFERPDTNTYWFDLVTWPGYLAINGDLISGYTFSRTADMFEFFWGSYGTDDPFYINPQYWAEKITCPKTETRQPQPDAPYNPETMDEAPWEWDASFLMSCHAIRWGIAKYRAAQ